ncbi:MAG: ABC transporter substrate-binding protein [Gemmataceae bacterium]
MLLFLGGCTRVVDPEPIWIGHLAPLSGPDQERGEDARRAMQLMLEEMRGKDRQVHGRTVAIRHVDASGGATARAEAVRLLAVNRVQALLVGPGVSGREEILASARGQGAPVLFLDEAPFSEGEDLANLAWTHLKLRQVRVQQSQEETNFRLLVDGFESRWRSLGGAQVSQARAEALTLVALPVTSFPDLMNNPAAILGPYLVPPGQVRSAQGFARVPFFSITAMAPGVQLDDEARAWTKRYQERFKLPVTSDVVLAHDGLGIVLAALEGADNTSRAALSVSLAGMKSFQGLTGSLTQKDGTWHRPRWLVRYKENQATVVGKLDPPTP